MNKKRALITGSSRGIGKGIAIALAKSGYDCVINFKSDEKSATEVVETIKKLGQRSFCVKADISDYSQVKNMFEKIEREFGGVDIIINNGGVSDFKLVQDYDEDEWQNIMNTNINGMFYCVKQGLPKMIEQKQGVIINISSIWGLVGSAMEVAYSTSKGAVISFTKALAKEVGYSGIRVNCIAPGLIDTDMTRSQLKDDDIESLIGDTPVGRIGTPEDIGDLVSFLVSDKGSFIHGQVITVDGGFIS